MADISRSTQWFYALPAFSLALVGLPLFIYIPKFYTDTVGVSSVLVGTVLITIRMLDAITDPAMGVLSDRSRWVLGRRRPFVFIGSIILVCSVLFLFIPTGYEGLQIFWFTVGMLGVTVSWTVVTVPYESWGAELSFQYDERTRLLFKRELLTLIGTVVAVLYPFVLDQFQIEPRAQMMLMALTYSPLIILSVWWTVYRVPDVSKSDPKDILPLVRDVKEIIQNKPFLILLAAFSLGTFASHLPATLILYYVEYVIGAKSAGPFLLFYLLAGAIFMPFWSKVSEWWDKKYAWLLALTINTIAFSLIYFLDTGDIFKYGILVAVSGIGFGGTLVIPASMQADVVHLHEQKHGVQQAGHFVGLWSIVKKAAAAMGIGISLIVLGNSGYEPGIAQSSETIQSLKAMYALVPSVLNVLSGILIFWYPIKRGDIKE